MNKSLSIQYSLEEGGVGKWDQSFVQNISVGGVKFTAAGDYNLKDKVIHLRIRLPDLAPEVMDIQAKVLEFKSRSNTKFFDVRALFVNITPKQKEQLAVLDKMINSKGNAA